MPAVLFRPLVTLVVFGHVGNGKSTLCNTLIGDITGTAFKESPNPGEETLNTIGKEGDFDGVRVCAIDTPGYGGAEGNTARHIVNMAEYIIHNTDVQVFVLVLNYQNPRFDEDLLKFFQLITGMYQGQSWLSHLAVVWTRFYPEHTDETEKSARKTVPKVGLKTFMPSITDEQFEAIPQFFIDSKDTRRAGDPGRTELAHLLAWASTKEPLSTLGEMRVKKGDPIIEKRDYIVEGEKWETKYDLPGRAWIVVGPKVTHYEIHQRFTKVFEERERQEYTSGDPTFSKWHQVRAEQFEKVIQEWEH